MPRLTGRTIRHVHRLCVVVALTAGCGAPKPQPDNEAGQPSHPDLVGVWYTVKRGDSVAAIAKRHQIPVIDVVELNGLERPERIEVGQDLFLYGVDEILRRRAKPVVRKDDEPAPGPSAGSLYIWPITTGRLSSGYGPRWGRMHKGVDIADSRGTLIRAARDGKVIYSDNKQRGYGNLVIIQHPGGHVTVYAHNERNLVDEGQIVRQGAPVARLGSSGKSTGPHLHFEVRVNGKAQNPLDFLPARGG